MLTIKRKKRRKKLDQMQPFEVDREYKKERVINMRMRNKAIGMDLARIRETLVERELILKQLSYILKAFQQQVLAIPNTYTRRLLHKSNEKEVHSILTEMAHRILSDLTDLPNKTIDPRWIQEDETSS